MGGMLGLATYGGRVNTVASDATASAQRRAIFDLACTTGWMDPGDDARNLAWVRAFYRELFAETRGVPLPGDAYDGALINHPDVDLADPALNRSGVPWHTLYYQANYPRLQRIKARWDPEIFSSMLCRFAAAFEPQRTRHLRSRRMTLSSVRTNSSPDSGCSCSADCSSTSTRPSRSSRMDVGVESI